MMSVFSGRLFRGNKFSVVPFVMVITVIVLLFFTYRSDTNRMEISKQLRMCKHRLEDTTTELEKMVGFKLRLERSLEMEKTNKREKVKELETLWNTEKEKRAREKQEAEKSIKTLNDRLDAVNSENERRQKDQEDEHQKFIELERNHNELSDKLDAVQLEKDKIISDLKEKLKAYEDLDRNKKVGDTADNELLEKLDGSHANSLSNSTTPKINPDAILENEEQKQVVPPPPLPQPKKSDEEIQKAMRESLNAGEDERKLAENAMNAPQLNGKEEINEPQQAELESAKKEEEEEEENQQKMFLPMPPNQNYVGGADGSQKSSSVASVVLAAGQRQMMPPLFKNLAADGGKNNEIPKQIKPDYNHPDYDNNNMAEEEEEAEYDEEMGAVKQGKPAKIPAKEQPEVEKNNEESVVVHPK